LSKSSIEALGLKEPLDRMKLLAYMQTFRILPYWTEDRGLIFRPHIGKKARQRFQQVLHLYGKEDVQRVRHELKQEFTLTRTRYPREGNQSSLKEDEIQEEIEKKTKARKRTRGPYRKSSTSHL
jgi:hypothetical protein